CSSSWTFWLIWCCRFRIVWLFVWFRRLSWFLRFRRICSLSRWILHFRLFIYRFGLPWLWLLRLFRFYRFFLFFYRRVLLTLIWHLRLRWRCWFRFLFIWRSFLVLWRSLPISIVFSIIR